MDQERVSFQELNRRWETMLIRTEAAVGSQPGAYQDLKRLAVRIVDEPLDIGEWLPTARKMADLLVLLDPDRSGSIFGCFHDYILPSDVWHAATLRIDCADLLDHLNKFDQWRREKRQLHVVR